MSVCRECRRSKVRVGTKVLSRSWFWSHARCDTANFRALLPIRYLKWQSVERTDRTKKTCKSRLSHKPPAPSDPGSTIPGMAQNFIECDREQELLLPPSLREWLPDGHLAWYVIDAVAEIDLEPFYSAYRSDGWGRAAFDPQMMVALLLYAYAIGERS